MIWGLCSKNLGYIFSGQLRKKYLGLGMLSYPKRKLFECPGRKHL